MLQILVRNRSFRSLWIGQLVSALGDRLTQMGILTFLMVISGDKGDKTALITFFTLLPFLLFAPLFGVLADRYSRKNLMIFADLIRAVLVLFIPAIWIYTHSLIFTVLWFFLLGSLTALFTPAKMSIIANITDKEALLEANSLIVTTGMVATLIGTIIAGAVIKVAGIRPAFYINSLTYLISAFFILKIFYEKPAYPQEASADAYIKLIRDIKSGVNYIFRHKLILSLILLSGVFSFISSFSYILLLNYGVTVLKQGSLGIGALLSCAGLGMVAGSLMLLKRKNRINYKRALYLSYLIIGVFSFSFLFRPAFYATLIVLFCAGIGVAILTITLDTIFQRVIPDELRGKIFASRGILANGVFLGSLLLVGFLIKHVSATTLFAIVGFTALFVSLRIFIYEMRWGYQLLRLFLKVLMRILFGFKVSGRENLPKTKRLVFAGNHTSAIDGVALMCAYPQRIYFLVAESFFSRGFWGWCAKRLGYIPVKRSGFNKEAVKQAMRILKSGYSIGIFPEGKITSDGRLEEGKEGAALIARLAGVDVVPFAIEGAHEAWPLRQRYPKPYPIEVRFGRPIDTDQFTAQEELIQEIMADISKVKLYIEREGYLRLDPDEIIKHLINIG